MWLCSSVVLCCRCHQESRPQERDGIAQVLDLVAQRCFGTDLWPPGWSVLSWSNKLMKDPSWNFRRFSTTTFLWSTSSGHSSCNKMFNNWMFNKMSNMKLSGIHKLWGREIGYLWRRQNGFLNGVHQPEFHSTSRKLCKYEHEQVSVRLLY